MGYSQTVSLDQYKQGTYGPVVTPKKKQWIISLDCGNGIERFAQNRSKTFDHSFTVVKREDAKRFESIDQCHRWLRRHGFYPWKQHFETYNSWEIVEA